MSVIQLHAGDGSGGRRQLDLNRFLAERQPDWIELDRLLEQAGPRLSRLPSASVLRTGRLYRSAAADLAIARRSFPGDPLVDRLELLVRRGRQLVYGDTGRRETLGHFLSRRYWRRVRERPLVLAAAAALLWLPLLGTAAWANSDPVQARRVAGVATLTQGGGVPSGSESADLGFSNVDSAAFSTQIFTNNAKVALIAFAGGITVGLLTVLVLVFNGFSIGMLAGLITAAGGGERFIRLVAPHGFLELSLITVAGMAGMRVGMAIIRPGHRRRGEALVSEARAAGELALGTALWLVPCGLVEGFVTPRGLELGPAIAVGVTLAAVFWAMVLWRGGEDGDTSPIAAKSRSREPKPRPATSKL